MCSLWRIGSRIVAAVKIKPQRITSCWAALHRNEITDYFGAGRLESDFEAERYFENIRSAPSLDDFARGLPGREVRC